MTDENVAQPAEIQGQLLSTRSILKQNAGLGIWGYLVHLLLFVQFGILDAYSAYYFYQFGWSFSLLNKPMVTLLIGTLCQVVIHISIIKDGCLILYPTSCVPPNYISRVFDVVRGNFVVLASHLVILGSTGVSYNLCQECWFSPSTLKLTVCITPAIALLLIMSAVDTQKYGNLVYRMCENTIVDFFDTANIFAMVITSSESSSQLPTSMVAITLVCGVLSLWFSSLPMIEQELYQQGQLKHIMKELQVFLLVLKILLVNSVLLVMHVVAWQKYNHEASFSVARNIFIIVYSIYKIKSCVR